MPKDITQLVKLRDLQSVLAHLPDPLIHTDAKGNVPWYNPSAASLFVGLNSQANALALIDLPEVQQAFKQAVDAEDLSEVDIKWGV